MKRNKKEDILLNTDNDDISMLAEIQTDPDEVTAMEFNKEIPVMPLRNMVMFPSVVMPVTIGRPSTLKLVNAAYKKKLPIAVVCQIQGDMDDPGFNDVYHVGVIGKILRVFEMPGGNTTVIMQSNGPKVHLDSITKTSPYLKGIVTPIPEANDQLETDEFKALIDTCKDLTSKFIEASEKMSPDTVFAIKNLDNPEILVNFICANFPIPVEEKIKLLKAGDLQSRLYMLVKILNREVQLADIKQSIQMRTREDIDRQQREYFLQQQIKNIQDELGAGQEDEIDELRQKGRTKKWSSEMAELFEKEVSKLERTNSQSPDFNVQLTYLQTLLGLPWNVFTTDNLNISNAEKTLNKDHYGLEKVKERILEHLAVLKLKGDMKSPIICLYGPPGVGKTSLGRSIAASLKRKYVRMSLGGVHDEAEIRGHRRTYIGAMPGRIISAINTAKSSNPVILLDEIDKLAGDYRGDPSSALLEVLDPEQNKTFKDNYLDIPFDLSNVLFITTANDASHIPGPLYDRMDVIELPSYTRVEKFNIARRHLLPKQLKNNGLESRVTMAPAALYEIIDGYTREAGVRTLERTITAVLRKCAQKIAAGEKDKINVTPAMVKAMLGPEKVKPTFISRTDAVGIANGLAWTSVGGEMLPIEVSIIPNGSGKVEITGSLGDVMKESAHLALTYARVHAETYHIAPDKFKNTDIHIHAPEGAVPKDGPSAGVTLTTALISALSEIPVRHDLAMTGEITLHGNVLPIGGLKEKSMAAFREGISTVLIPEANKPDLYEVDEEVKKAVKFIPVSDLSQVLKHALILPAASAAHKRTMPQATQLIATEQSTAKEPAAVM